jgi:Putative transposase/Transposase zinc-binding domain
MTDPLKLSDFAMAEAATKGKNETKYHLADIYTQYMEGYLKDPNRKLFIGEKHLRAVNRSRACREYGCNSYACGECGDVVQVKMSCHHRFCARCGAAASNKWAEKLNVKLLNILHGHLVFTLPFFLRALSKRNEAVFYEALFKLASKAVRDVLREKYEIEVGTITVLHTYGSDLKYHPHVHMIVSCGGIRRKCVQAMKSDYLCDHKELAGRFEKLFKEHLCALYAQNALNTEGVLDEGQDMQTYIESNNTQQWIVGLNLGIRDTKHLISYCGRYLRRACLSEYRLQSIDKGEISFTFKDYKNTPRGEKTIINTKTMSSTAFLDKLLQHVPEKGFVGVRYCGIYANASKALEKCGYIKPNMSPKSETNEKESEAEMSQEESDLKMYRRTLKEDLLICECCGEERLLISSSMKAVVFKYFTPLNDS